MKLKPIVASLMLLGLAAPAFADDSTANAATQPQLDSMKAQINTMQAIINQNSVGGFDQPCDWMNRITVSGMINVDGYYSNRTQTFGFDPRGTSRVEPILPPGPGDRDTFGNGGNTNNLDINNANLIVDALVNDWTNVHINVLHTDRTNDAFTPWLNNVNATFDEAYVTIGNFCQSPVYFRAGREYIPFGVYQRYPMVMNPTQMLTETRATAAQLGFVSPVGVYGSLYAFRGLASDDDVNFVAGGEVQRPRVANWGADLGYAYCDNVNDWNTKLDAGWIRNMADVNYIAQNLGNNYEDQVHGLSLSADFGFQAFDASLRYVKALGDFDRQDIAEFDKNRFGGVGDVENARPSAYGAEVGYSFAVVNNHSSRVAVGYQHTKESSSNVFPGFPGISVASVGGFGMPQERYYGSYTVNVSKWTDVGFELYHDRDYSTRHFGTGKNATAAAVQLGVKFA